MSYQGFINTKLQEGEGHGFDPVDLHGWLYDFQKSLVEWALTRGRAAIFADCGLGKTPMQLSWADNVARHTNRQVLILTPLAVSHQTIREGQKFGIECTRSIDGSGIGDITITNYERLQHFNPADFAGVVCDESSIMKNFNGKRKAEITEFMRTVPYRLLCTATAAPNDYHELGTSSEALGYLGYTDMITRFFKEDSIKNFLGWGRKAYRFRGHAEEPFWRWVCSWARAIRKPSDIGYSDDRFILPELNEHEYIVRNSTPRDGMLFSTPAKTLEDQREERKITLAERCELASSKAIEHDGASVVWCHLNDEGNHLVDMIPGAVQVSGSMTDERKEERLLAFQAGEIKTLVTKPKIGCFGLNWQHCHNVICFPSHSFEQYYQAVRRCWRFGQCNQVEVSIVTTEGEIGVLRNLQRKSRQASEMFDSLTRCMGDALHINRGVEFTKKEEVPSWL